jgi:GTPase SAR1 family protein
MMEETDTSRISDGNERKVKVSVVGDSGVGKTCLLMAFANNKFPDEDICCQSLFENSKGTVRGKSINECHAQFFHIHLVNVKIY